MKLLVDMNLSPDWIEVLTQSGWEAIHWSMVGDPRATDKTIMEWALTNGYVIFTHDLDFGTLLAVTQALGPSVVQIRTQDVMVRHLGKKMAQILAQYQTALEDGALVTIDEAKSRIRILPLLE